MSSASRKRFINTVATTFLTMVALTAGAQSHVLSQCDPGAAVWLDRLASIEMMDASVTERTEQLVSLKHAYEKCVPQKDSVYARIVHRLGDFFRIEGDFETGIRLALDAVRVNAGKQPGSQPSYLAHSYYNLGLYHHLLGLLEEAHSYYDSCIITGYQFPEKLFIALMALEKKAFMYFQSGDYERSIAVSEQGRALSQRYGYPDYESLMLVQKAQSELELHQTGPAMQNILRAIEILKENKMEEYLANTYSVYANVLSRHKRFGEATLYYTKAAESNLLLHNEDQAARDFHDLGFLYDKELNDPERSIMYYNEALKVLAKLRDPNMQSTTYNNIGQLYWRKRDFTKALEYYQKALMSLPMHFNDTDVRNNPNVSQLRSAQNEYITAALLWNKGDAWLGMYTRDQNKLFLQRAIDAYRTGDLMVDQMRWKQQGEQSKLFWREKTKRWYAKAVEASFLLNDVNEAFYFMEKSRAVLLNDKLAELGAKNQLPRKEAETEKALRIRLKSALTATGSPDHAGALDKIWKAERDLDDFIRKLEKRYPSYYAYKYDTAVSSVAEVRNILTPGNQAWIEFFTHGDTIYSIAITNEAATLKKVYFNDHKAMAKRITDLCSSRNSINSNYSQYQALANLYYKMVFQPLGITANRVIISQDEYFLPFDLLQSDSLDQTSFLVRKHAFSYAYSATQFLRAKIHTTSDSESLLAIAPVQYESHLRMQELIGADQSLEKIGTTYHGGVLLTGNKATKRSFLKQIPQFKVIHLYSHAKADTLGQEPVIYFYDSALNLSELQDLAGLRTQLIVLLACNSGIGRAVKGEGIFSLARGFAAAGIPSTVSALWEIDNQATYILAERFFEKLANGEPSDVALQNAKIEMIHDYDRDYELPYYWAGAILIGKADMYKPADRSPAMFRILLWGVTIGFIAWILIALRRRQWKTNTSA